MNFQIVERKTLADKTIDLSIQINSKDQIIFCFILESWEGVFNYTTIDKKKSLIKVLIAEDFAQEADNVLNFLKKY